ncbi:MAG TPA: DNA polymerase I [Treponemataceae bacterium]|nr:DNA polymerase I [Treponemataceae bacterium]
MKDNTIYIFDSYGLIYRAYYAFVSRPLINPQGQNVSAVHGFFRNLLFVIKKYGATYAAASFDSREPTFRHLMYEEYKANRQKTPEDLHAQVPIIEEILESLGFPILRVSGVEADDIIASLCGHCSSQKRQCRILSSDKDLMQLINDYTRMLSPDKTEVWSEVDEEAVLEKWGVPPHLMLDFLSLVGDSSDNVKGVAGVGEKTALKLLTEYGSLDKILENAEKIPGAIGKKVVAGKDDALFARKLIALKNDVDVPENLENYEIKNLDFLKAAEVLEKYGLMSIAKSYREWGSREKSAQNAEKNRDAHEDAEGDELLQKSHVANSEESKKPIQKELVKNSGNYKAIKTKPELEKLIETILTEFSKKGREDFYLAFDTETDGLDTRKAEMLGFSLSYIKGEAFYIPLTQEGSLFSQSSIEKKDALESLAKLFYQPGLQIVMQNAKFDYQVLKTNGLTGDFQCEIFDTMIAAWILDADRGSFSFDALCASELFLETIPFSDIVPKGGSFLDVPLDQAVDYAAEDADLTLQLWKKFEKQLKTEGLLDLFLNLESPLIPILAEMEDEGIHIEKADLEAYSKELSSEIEELSKDIYDLVGHEFNIASPKQLQEVLFVERELPATKKIKTGFSTDTSVLEELREHDPIIPKLLEYRQLSKLLSTYVDALPKLADENNRIHTSFMQTGTATGRLSSRDPNLQNIPIRDEEGRKIRQAFTAPAGRSLISSDYSQIELVVLAHLSQDENLMEAFRSGVDIHKATASLIFSLPLEHVTQDMRRSAKTINFGIMYGMSAFRLSNDLSIPRFQAQQFIDNYFASYPGIQNFIQNTIMEAEDKGYVETMLGRRRYIKQILSGNKNIKAQAERMAINTPIQGTAADIVKKAMIAVDGALKKQFPRAKLLLQVHDELIFECDTSEVAEIKALIKKEMEEVVQLSVPLRVSIESGKSWGDFH